MKLDNYLRSVIFQHMFKYINVCSCEICGSTVDLNIHHSDMYFFEMVDKTLEDLCLPFYQEKEKYTDDEIEKISIYLLGLHLKKNFSILCEKCHKNIHKINRKRMRRRPRERQLAKNEYIDKLKANSYANKFIVLLEEIQKGLHTELIDADGRVSKVKIREILGIKSSSNFSNKVLNKKDVLIYCQENGVYLKGYYIKFANNQKYD